MNRVFIDMDGVVVDFDAYKNARGLSGDEIKAIPGAYLEMPPIPGALEAVRSVIGMGFEVWLATKPPTGVAHAYGDKAAWVLKHLPEMKRRIIITHDKGLLGDIGDILCDDRPHKANCEKFAGQLLRFVDDYHWPQALADLRTRRDAGFDAPDAPDIDVDVEAIAWAYRKLLNFSMQNGSQESALMMDRLNLMLLQSSTTDGDDGDDGDDEDPEGLQEYEVDGLRDLMDQSVEISSAYYRSDEVQSLILGGFIVCMRKSPTGDEMVMSITDAGRAAVSEFDAARENSNVR